MILQDFNVGDEVVVTGVQDGLRFENTPCKIVYFSKYPRTDRAQMYTLEFERGMSKEYHWNVLYPKNVHIEFARKDYDPTQQPWDEGDI